MTTLKDVAKKCSVDISTVSRALAGNPLVNKKTRMNICRVAEELNYRPHLPARMLAGRPSKTIGIIVWGVETNYYARIIKSVEQYLYQYGYMLIVGIGNKNYEKELHCLESFNSRLVDGIILVGPFSKKLNSELPKLKSLFLHPSVIIQSDKAHALANNIAVDDYTGILSAVKYLAELGHRKIGYISIEKSRVQLSDFRDAISACGLSLDEKFVKIRPEAYEIAGYKAMQDLLLENELPTAIFFSTDYYAIGAAKAIREHGLQIPRDISLVGFYGIRESLYAVPPLTTVQVPVQEIVLMATQQILTQIESDEAAPNISLTVQPELVIRESCAPPLNRS